MALTTVSNAGLGGSIDLTAKVTGTLPIANGGTNSTSTTFVNMTSNVTGTLPIANGGTNSTSTTFVNMTSNVTGTLPAANGGTGATSFSPGKINQVVWVEDGTYASSTSSVMASANLSTSLTPSASDSKILILMDVKGMKASGNTGIQTQISGKVGAAAEGVLRQFTGEAGGN